MFQKLRSVIKNERQLDLRLRSLALIGRLLVPKYRFKWTQIDWWNNRKFDEYLIRFDELRGFNTDRRWMLWQLMRLVANVPGDTAECGVYTGAGSYLICKANRNSQFFDRYHYLFDSFEGLSEPTELDSKHWEKGELACGLDIVKANLSEFQKVSFHKGWIPERFIDVEDKRFAFIHIDVDLYAPTRDSIAFFYPRVNPGGIIVCDDYGSSICPGATRAIDEYLWDKPEKMLALPDGAGFMVKGCVTELDAFGSAEF